MSYQIKLEAFQGPFDLLLHLIKKEEIDIYNIPVAKITEEYLSYIKLMQVFNLEVTGEFLVMAGTLLYIKSRMLLPSHTDDEESSFMEDVDDPRKELVQQLLEYKKFKKSARLLEIREVQQKDIFFRIDAATQLKQERMLEVSLFDLIDAFKNVLRKNIKETKEIIQEEVSVQEKMQEILNKIKDKDYIDFYEVFGNNVSKMSLIATFLALLELIRLKEVKVRQIKLFASIRIYKVKQVEKETVTKQLDLLEPEQEQETVLIPN